MNDRIALEIGRAVLRALIAEEQRDQLMQELEKLQAPEDEARGPDPGPSKPE